MESRYALILEIGNERYEAAFDENLDEENIISSFEDYIAADNDFLGDIGFSDCLSEYVSDIIHQYHHIVEPVYNTEDIHNRMVSYAVNRISDESIGIALYIKTMRDEIIRLPHSIMVQQLTPIIESALDPAWELYSGYYIRAIVEALEAFIQNAQWQFGFRSNSGGKAPSECESEEAKVPFIWFGLPGEKAADPWSISPFSTEEDLAFWFLDMTETEEKLTEEEALRYLIIDNPQYGEIIRWGISPDIDYEEIRKTCPIMLEALFNKPEGQLVAGWKDMLRMMLQSFATEQSLIELIP